MTNYSVVDIFQTGSIILLWVAIYIIIWRTHKLAILITTLMEFYQAREKATNDMLRKKLQREEEITARLKAKYEGDNQLSEEVS